MRPISEEVYGIPRDRVIGSSTALDYTSDDRGGTITRKPEADVLDDGPRSRSGSGVASAAGRSSPQETPTATSRCSTSPRHADKPFLACSSSTTTPSASSPTRPARSTRWSGRGGEVDGDQHRERLVDGVRGRVEPAEDSPASRARGRGVVYVSLHCAKITDQPVEDAKIVAEEMVRWLRDIEGFDGFLMLTGESSAIGSPSGRAVRSRLGIRSPAGSSSSACCRSRESSSRSGLTSRSPSPTWDRCWPRTPARARPSRRVVLAVLTCATCVKLASLFCSLWLR